MSRTCDHCGESHEQVLVGGDLVERPTMQKYHFDDPTWDYPDRDYIWMCMRVDCILDRTDVCTLFGHDIERRGSIYTCPKCDRTWDEHPDGNRNN